MASGYIYVLSNPSIPGQLKVGKTARAPENRVEELSAATGVPTPFVVEHSRFFDDCDTAEKLIHRELETRGHRVSNRREFFQMDRDEVIEIVEQMAGIAEETTEEVWEQAETFFTEGQRYEYGDEATLVDLVTAAYFYKQASSKGHLEAAYRAATVLAELNRAPEALVQATIASQGGHIAAHRIAGRIFEEAGQLVSTDYHYKQFAQNIEKLAKLSPNEEHELVMYFVTHADNIHPYTFAALKRHRVTVLNGLAYPNLGQAWKTAWQTLHTEDEKYERISEAKSEHALLKYISLGAGLISIALLSVGLAIFKGYTTLWFVIAFICMASLAFQVWGKYAGYIRDAKQTPEPYQIQEK